MDAEFTQIRKALKASWATIQDAAVLHQIDLAEAAINQIEARARGAEELIRDLKARLESAGL
jgi:hypothetical protein